jgi:hypothetical protein
LELDPENPVALREQGGYPNSHPRRGRNGDFKGFSPRVRDGCGARRNGPDRTSLEAMCSQDLKMDEFLINNKKQRIKHHAA